MKYIFEINPINPKLQQIYDMYLWRVAVLELDSQPEPNKGPHPRIHRSYSIAILYSRQLTL